MQIKPKALIKALATYVPVLNRWKMSSTGGTGSARYCYSVWLRHLTLARKAGMATYPQQIAELGPGDSIGTGLAALIAGAKEYIGLDVIEYINLERNLAIFDELVELYRKREPIPSQQEFPLTRPTLEDHRFPSEILSDAWLEQALHPDRIASIRAELASNTLNRSIRYRAPWTDKSVVLPASIDYLFSQAVMEHVVDLAETYHMMNVYLKPGGYMSHSIDFCCHHTTKDWNGHWAISQGVWKTFVQGNRPYLINRACYSEHEKYMRNEGFEILYEQPELQLDGIQLRQLASQFAHFTEKDLTTRSMFVISRKP